MKTSTRDQADYYSPSPRARQIRVILQTPYMRDMMITICTQDGTRFKGMIDFHEKEDGIIHLRGREVCAGDNTVNEDGSVSFPEEQVSWVFIHNYCSAHDSTDQSGNRSQ